MGSTWGRRTVGLGCVAAVTMSVTGGVGPADAHTTRPPMAYTVNLLANTVTPINTATNTAGRPIPVGSNPTTIAITPDGRTVYVANAESNTVTPIATATNKPGKPITVGKDPSYLAITPNGAKVYVSNLGDGTVTPIATATNKAGTPISVGVAPGEIAITPDGRTAYVACFNVHVAPGRPGLGAVTPINIATNRAGRHISLGHAFPDYFAINSASTTAYVTSDAGVTPISVATNTAGPAIKADNGPWAIETTPNGRFAYVTDIGPANSPARKVTVIRLATKKVVKTITVGLRPVALAITP